MIKIINHDNSNNLTHTTAEEIQKQLDEGKAGFLSFRDGYIIEGARYYASGLTLFPNETKIFEREGKLIVTACFREYKLHRELRTGNDDNLIQVECELINTDQVWVSMHDLKEVK
jgi:hypothetical protein